MATPVVVSDEHLRNLSGQWLVGRYQLGGVRAQGALCVVYDAHDSVLRRPVVIKVSPLAVADAYREALEATGGLSHPAFLAIYDVIEQDGCLHIAQELIDGRPLSDYLTDGAPARRSVAIALQLARAIAYAHQHDVAHGDLTPSAILVDRYAVAHINNVRLPPDWEFFAALSSAVAESGGATSAEVTLAALRSDERLRDIWSIGVTLWTLLSSAIGDGSSQDGASARAFRDDVTPEARRLVERTIDIAHAERITSADELALAIEALDAALARSASDQRQNMPEAVRAYRDAQVSGDAYGKAAKGYWRMTPTHDDRRALVSAASDVTEPFAVDTSQTRPANGPMTDPTGRRRSPRPYDAPAAPTNHYEWDEQPLWPGPSSAAAADIRPMRPWAWTLIGLALFVAFFLIGYLVVPQLTLF